MPNTFSVLYGAAAVAAVSLSILGCGDDSSVPALRLNGPITKREAARYARAVNLGVADVPDMSSIGFEQERPPEPSDRLARCTGATARSVARLVSPDFQRSHGLQLERVSSGVTVYQTATIAARDFSASTDSRGRACLTRLLPLTARALRDRRPGPARVSFLISPLAHIDVLAVRLRVPVFFKRTRPPLRAQITMDEFDVVSGRATIDLTAIGAPNPVPAATERHLLSLLYNRGKA
jgi:hypothetical protein